MGLVRIYSAALLFFLPTRIARLLIFSPRIKISPDVRIGWSLIDVDRLDLQPGSRIGHLNVVKGSMGLRLAPNAAIGHMNLILRSRIEGNSDAELFIGEWSKITGSHRVDLTRSISIGAYSTLAGHGSQMWTHGYVHELQGIKRYRLDGEIRIGSNVSIGSGCIISMGVTIGDGVLIGAGAVIAKDLIEQGLYVSAGLRHLSRPEHPTEKGFERVPSKSGDIVFRKPHS